MPVSLSTFLLCHIHSFLHSLEMHSLHDVDLPSYNQKIQEAVNIYAERQIDAQR